MDYDLARDRLCVFGGNLSGAISDDWWEFDPAVTDWAQTTTANVPTYSFYPLANMAFYPPTRTFVIFGANYNTPGPDHYIPMTWEYDPSTRTFTEIPVAHSPSGALHGAMCYWPAVGKIVYTCGFSYTRNLRPAETWTFDYADWVLLPTANHPIGRVYPNMCVDGSDDDLLLFGGVSSPAGSDVMQADTWKLQSQTMDWNNVIPATSPDSRMGTYLAQAGGDGCVMQGGEVLASPNFNRTDALLWDGVNWTLDSAGNPGSSERGHMTYLSSVNKCLWFGGFQGGYSQETWYVDGFSRPRSRERFSVATAWL